MSHEPTLFEKIICGDIPADFEYTDDTCVVLHDINPQAPIHILIIPRKPIPRITAMEPGDKEIVAHLLAVAAQMADRLQLDSGFRIIINNGPDGGESVPHLHVHLLGGRPMTWPPG